MEINLSQKIPQKFNCISCDYFTSNKKDYKKHISTLKHQSQCHGNNLEKNGNKKSPNFLCECNKSFITYSGLWKHKQKCNFEQFNCLEEKDEDFKLLTNMVLEVVKQNHELMIQNNETQKQNQELTNKLFEICKNGTNNTMINNNSHNKTFNLQFFLNETCKDAMNIMDFVESIKLQLSDLEKVAEIGFVDGISNIITSNLKALDVTQRPIHCADKKREILYIKDENKWEKEDENKKRLRKAIKKVVSKNQRLLPIYKEEHPDCGKSSSIYSDQYNKMIVESMGGTGNNDLEKEDKIIKKITKEVMIDKSLHL
jgi:hypothetical protein